MPSRNSPTQAGDADPPHVPKDGPKITVEDVINLQKSNGGASTIAGTSQVGLPPRYGNGIGDVKAAVDATVEQMMLEALFSRGDDIAETTVTIQLPPRRPGGRDFEFKVRPLTDLELEQIAKETVDYTEDEDDASVAAIGTVRPVKNVRLAEQRSLTIVRATVPEHRRVLWNNQTVLSHYHVVADWQVVDRVLTSGEKERVYNKIQEISGYPQRRGAQTAQTKAEEDLGKS